MTIINSTLSNNTAARGGGAFNVGTLDVTNSTVSGNTSTGNTAGDGGGAGYNAGTLNIVSSTISDNMANREGAGIYNSPDSTLTISNSTFSGNVASLTGGAVFNLATLQLANSTLSNNSATFLAGGILNFGQLQIGNTILNAGASGVNLYVNGGGTVTSLGYNLSSDDAGGFLTGPGDQVFTNPMLGPLHNNGGPTLTHALLPGSPAIDTGDPNFTPPPLFDQRGPGFDRVVNGRIDKGSFEVQAPTVQSASSRKTHGAAGTFDIPLPLTGSVGVECRTTGGTNDYMIVVTFGGNVIVMGSPQAQVTLGTGCVGSAGTCTGNVTVIGNTVTIPLTNIANAQTISVRINGVNSAGADAPATDFTIPMSILIGDTNANGTVNAADVAQTKARLGHTVDATSFRSDVNANGTLNAGDIAIVKQNSGTSLPPQ
jgi:hypothetical protein